MATIREWLNELEFNWEEGRIILQPCEGNPYWGKPLDAKIINPDDPILDEEFNDEIGGDGCPRILAEDDSKIFFPCQYHRSSWLEFVYKNVSLYLDWEENIIPYPGN